MPVCFHAYSTAPRASGLGLMKRLTSEAAAETATPRTLSRLSRRAMAGDDMRKCSHWSWSRFSISFKLAEMLSIHLPLVCSPPLDTRSTMARMTRQFLTSTVRPREYDTETVVVEVSLMADSSHPEKNWLYLRFDGGGSIGRQYLYLGRTEARALTMELLRCVRTDRELVQILNQYFHGGRRKPPVVVELQKNS